MSGLFSSKKSQQQGPQFEKLYDPFESSRGALNSYLTENIGKKGPTYAGERVAPLSGLEEQSLDYADRYANQPLKGQSMQLAEDEIKKTLSGDYDPSTSTYYQAVKAEAERNLEDTQSRIADKAGGGGRYFGGARLRAQGNAARDTGISLNKTLGEMSERERERRFQAVPQALAVDSAVTGEAAKRAQTLQAIGALPREIQQAFLDAIYQEFLLSEYEYPLNIAQIAGGPAQREPIFVQQGYGQQKPAIGQQILSLLSY